MEPVIPAHQMYSTLHVHSQMFEKFPDLFKTTREETKLLGNSTDWIKLTSPQAKLHTDADAKSEPIDITRTITDPGTDSDDEVHNRMRIRGRKQNPHENTTFVVNGSNAYYAAAALFQLDRFLNPELSPIRLVLGEEHESAKTASREIPSYLDGRPIQEHHIPGFHPEAFDGSGKAKPESGLAGVVTDAANRVRFQGTPIHFSVKSLDEDVAHQQALWKHANIRSFAQFQIAPIHDAKELFIPHVLMHDIQEPDIVDGDGKFISKGRLHKAVQIDPSIIEKFENTPKLFVHQMQDLNGLRGNNYAKSQKETLNAHIEQEAFLPNSTVVKVDGENAKVHAVSLDATQRKDLGTNSRVIFHTASLKRAWADFIKNGFVGDLKHLRLGVLDTPDLTPLVVNWSGRHGQGMNLVRLLKELGITEKENPKLFKELFDKLESLTDRLDEHTMKKAMSEDAGIRNAFSSPLEKMDAETLADYQAHRHDTSVEATPELWLAKSRLAHALAPNGFKNLGEDLHAKTNNGTIFGYGATLAKQVEAIEDEGPILMKLTEYRHEALNENLGDGKSYVESFMDILKETGGMQFYGYDPYAVYGGIEIASKPELRKTFAVNGNQNHLNFNLEARKENPLAASQVDSHVRDLFQDAGYQLKYELPKPPSTPTITPEKRSPEIPLLNSHAKRRNVDS